MAWKSEGPSAPPQLPLANFLAYVYTCTCAHVAINIRWQLLLKASTCIYTGNVLKHLVHCVHVYVTPNMFVFVSYRSCILSLKLVFCLLSRFKCRQKRILDLANHELIIIINVVWSRVMLQYYYNKVLLQSLSQRQKSNIEYDHILGLLTSGWNYRTTTCGYVWLNHTVQLRMETTILLMHVNWFVIAFGSITKKQHLKQVQKLHDSTLLPCQALWIKHVNYNCSCPVFRLSLYTTKTIITHMTLRCYVIVRTWLCGIYHEYTEQQSIILRA